MNLQLYAVLVDQPALRTDTHETPSMRTLSCLLQVDGLTEQHHLDVAVNAPLKYWDAGMQQMFSWELQEQRDEIHLSLHEVTISTSPTSTIEQPLIWRGIWKGDALFSVGSLPVRVFFNGREQPGLTVSPLHLLESRIDPFPVNGHRIVVPAAVSPSGSSVDAATPDKHAVPSDGWTAQEAQPQAERDSMDADVDDVEETFVEEDGDDADPDDDEEYYDEGDGESEEDEVEDSDAQTVLAEDSSEATSGSAFATGLSSAPASAIAPFDPLITPSMEPSQPVQESWGQVATFHLSPVNAEQTLAALHDLLAKLPKKTVLVDLREKHQLRQKDDSFPLSSAHLHKVFGGKYWDRSAALKTRQQLLPEAQQTMVRRWERVLHEPEHPDGLAALERYLRSGYSMVFLDALATYTESARYTVVEALRRRMPGLEVALLSPGSLSGQ